MILFKRGTGCTAHITEVTSNGDWLVFETTRLDGARGGEMELNRDEQLELAELLIRHARTGKLEAKGGE